MPAGNRRTSVEKARAAAVDVLVHNTRHGTGGLPRTAGWGYPEPYTRDLMIAAPGFLLSGQDDLVEAVRRTLRSLSRNQSVHGLVPGLANDPQDLGASDTTPLFLIGLAAYRAFSGEKDFLDDAAQRALEWMAHQSPDDRVMVAQQPTSDWRDEQWVEGYGLYVNALHVMALALHGRRRQAEVLRSLLNRPIVTASYKHAHDREGLRVPHKPYYALWSLKVHSSDRFDLVGNTLAVIGGIPSRPLARNMMRWVEQEISGLRERRLLARRLPPGLPPVLFPYIRQADADWRPRYDSYNRPGEYHNGGLWPFACGLYVAAQVAAGRPRMAQRALDALTDLVRVSADQREFGFNEWFGALDGRPRGHDWQTWSAATYIYAVACVEQQRTPFLDGLRRHWRG